MPKKQFSSVDLYPRTLYEWLKTDVKKLKAAIASCKTVFEIADELQRDPVSVLMYLDAQEVVCCEPHTEEWVEVMSLSLAHVPLDFVIGWCNADPKRLPYEMFISFANEDLTAAFQLAFEHHLIVANARAVEDLLWLAEQEDGVKEGYGVACEQLTNVFEVLTPLTLKRQVQGFVAAPLPRNWMHVPAPVAPSTSRRRSYRRKSTSSPKTAGTSRRTYARKRSTKSPWATSSR